MRRITLLIILSSLLSFTYPTSRVQAISYTFTTFNAPGAVFTQARGVNNLGQIVGTYFQSGSVPPDPLPPGLEGISYGWGGPAPVDPGGWTVPFVYDNGTFTPIATSLTAAPNHGGPSTADDINDAGQIVGHSGDGNYLVPMAKVPTDNFLLGSPYLVLARTNVSGFGQTANGISNNGHVVVSSEMTGSDLHAFIYDSDTHGLTNISSLLGPSLIPLDINDSGAFLAGGFLFDQGIKTEIAFPGAKSTRPSKINDQGDIVGNFIDTDGGHGFLLSHGVYTQIDIPGGGQVLGINDLGWIVGSSGTSGFLGIPDQPDLEKATLRLVSNPEPASWISLISGVIILLIRRRRFV